VKGEVEARRGGVGEKLREKHGFDRFWKMHSGVWPTWLLGAWAHLSRRRWARNRPRVVRAIVRAGRTTTGLARGGGVAGARWAAMSARMRGGQGRPRGWELGRARVGPGRENGALGRAGGGGKRGRRGPGWAVRTGQGRGGG
jgi:hypothetical protein